MMDFDMVKPVVRKKYIPSYDSIWRITNSNLFRKKSLIFWSLIWTKSLTN